jgi:hypothetical protein
MIQIAREDAPWVWGIHPKSLALSHAWYRNVVPNAMANNTLKYKRIDAALRVKKQQEWNQPVLMPLILMVLFVFLMIVALRRIYKNRQNRVICHEENVC